MSLFGLGFLSPFVLFGLLSLPVIWWLLRASPPRPQQQTFPPTKVLRDLLQKETTPAHSPWWLTLLRLLVAGLIILALARPVLNQASSLLKSEAKEGALLLMVDNGWAAADQWAARKAMMKRLLKEAQIDQRPVYFVPTVAADPASALEPLEASSAAALLDQHKPLPLAGDRLAALSRLQTLVGTLKEVQSLKGSELFWLSDGLAFEDKTALTQALTKLQNAGVRLSVIAPSYSEVGDPGLALGLSARLGQGGALYAHVFGAASPVARRGDVLAVSGRGDVLTTAPFELAANTEQVEVKIELPLELRNQIVKLELKNTQSAGAVHLLDQRSAWRRIGLVSSASGLMAQPLLSPLYYINRALEPFAEIYLEDEGDAIEAVKRLATPALSVIVMADVGVLFGEPLLRLTEWVEQGGVLVRFAGPRMEKSQDALLPTPLRLGGRRLGGALSWSKPQHLAAFDQESPFAGLTVPDEVVVTQQILADPAQLSDDVFIWARLKDGTPLVTAKQELDGWVVLVHVTANSEWSNLPLSGLFVEMLKRLTHLSRRADIGTAQDETSSSQNSSERADQSQTPGLDHKSKTLLLPPRQLLDGFGRLRPPAPEVEPLVLSQINALAPSLRHPPGFYGPADQQVALNLFPKITSLQALDVNQKEISLLSYQKSPEVSLRGPLFITAFLLLLLDGLAVMWLRGVFSFSGITTLLSPRNSSENNALVVLFVLAVSLLPVTPLYGQEKNQSGTDFKFSLHTHLAYVLTGQAEIDKTSREGLEGLSTMLRRRTSVEPKAPIGVDLAKDELAFYPLLYWPVGPYSPPLTDKVAARVNAYMKHGGMIIFDTKDQNSRIGGLEGRGQKILEKLLAKLDIPRLEPVPSGHVLSKSFYLLSQFPGRFQGSPLWVEAQSKRSTNAQRQASEIDGVSTILVTANDFAAAWAVDRNSRPLYPVVPGGQLQREMAYRVGVNIVMYALAGNYKADQVHVPALLERLGQ